MIRYVYVVYFPEVDPTSGRNLTSRMLFRVDYARHVVRKHGCGEIRRFPKVVARREYRYSFDVPTFRQLSEVWRGGVWKNEV